MTDTAVLVVDCRCGVGESPLWDPDRGGLWWVDIPGRAIHFVGLDGRGHRIHAMSGRPAALGLCTSGRLAVGMEDSVWIWSPESGAIDRLAQVEHDRPMNRLNDGKVGPDGAFWIGSMNDQPEKTPTGALWRVTVDGRAERKVTDVIISNGLAWTADGRTMFHADSRGVWLDRWSFDPATGAISDRTRIVTFDGTDGRPDGGACDMDGTYWSATIYAGRLTGYDRDGRVLAKVPVPVETPTMPGFAGPDLRDVFVTSLRTGKEAADAPAGGLWRLSLGPAGVPVTRFPA